MSTASAPAGEAGVAKAIDILKKELDVTMALTGTNRVGDIGRDVIVGMEAKKKPARKRKKTASNSRCHGRA